MTAPANLVVLMSDQHNRRMSGCYGHAVVRTPRLDALAASGTVFDAAYCNSPICVPSRASMATGRYAHDVGSWDNAFPFTGEVASWGRRLDDAGHHVTTIGKLHFRSTEDDTGFVDQRLPMHVHEGRGDLYSLIREDMSPRSELARDVLEPGVGTSSYARYDAAIADEAVRFLSTEAGRLDAPWALFVSFTLPHHPLIAPPEYAALYPPEAVELPRRYDLADRPMHPVLEELRRVLGFDGQVDELTVRRAVATYYALCTYLDDQCGRVLDALEASGLADATRVLYTSDHGDTVGDHGMWTKHTMYEGSVGIPLIVAGPGVPAGRRCATPVSLVDLFPTILECVGVPATEADEDLPGTSLLGTLDAPDGRRVVFGEYHAEASQHGFFMVRDDRYKYVEYVGAVPQLFDLEADPEEAHDLAGDPAHAALLQRCARELREICDPGAVDRAAHAAQRRLIDAWGGEEAVRGMGYDVPFTPAPIDDP